MTCIICGQPRSTVEDSPYCSACRTKYPKPPDACNIGAGSAINQKHYTATTVQPIEIMQMHLTAEEFQGFLKCNIIKYVLRAGKKDEVEREIDKVVQYAKWLRQALDGKIIDPMEDAKI